MQEWHTTTDRRMTFLLYPQDVIPSPFPAYWAPKTAFMCRVIWTAASAGLIRPWDRLVRIGFQPPDNSELCRCVWLYGGGTHQCFNRHIGRLENSAR